MAGGGALYEFTLPERFHKVAEIELGETDQVREQSLTELRKWIENNPRILECRTDVNFLLKFLRFRKFSVTEAGEAIERYLVARQKHPKWFQGMDPREEGFRLLQESGVVVEMGQDEHCRTILIMRSKQYSPDRDTSTSIIKHLVGFVDLLTEQEEVQIGGVRVWIDYKNMPLRLITLFGPIELAGCIPVFTKTLPLRIREVHGVGIPKAAVAISTLALTFASEKFRKRVQCHASIEEGKKCMPPNLWPTEFGGSIDAQQLGERMSETFEQNRDFLLSFDAMAIDVKQKFDSPISEEQNQTTQQLSPDADNDGVENFRDLKVD
ncbi:alpha-tocopherol transfer protein-like [Uranotaenia lowii]|uniref:alpha-tocopherol transfer protein-like n=1 Tax=Uranotaenia lowii TaxID=190385 RepID=UPI00247B0D91|nr:alpha-tocopherol transfer protein-like [Uranotaenia lowii]